jgi:multiple sugar transport system permease protein
MARSMTAEERRHKVKHHYTPGYIVWTIFKYFSLVFISFWMVIPLYSCVVTSFKTDTEYNSTNVMTPPSDWLNFSNFADAFSKANMGVAFRNSGIILVCVLAGSIIIGTQIAYVLNRFKFPGNGLIRNLFTFAALLPGIAMQVATYEIMNNLHFINHLYGYIILSMGTDVISIYIYIQYFENISVALDESAIIDGASYHTIYWRILLPMLRPAIVTCVILKGATTYNEYYNANLYLQDKQKLCTVATSLYTFTGPMGSRYNLICAGVIISMLPALVVFIIFQNSIYNGIAAGAVKG